MSPLSFRRVIGYFALMAAAWLVAPSPALAQSSSPYYWDVTGTSTWETTANWNSDPSGAGGTSAVPVSTNDAVFNGSADFGATVVQLGAPEAAMGLYFNNTGTTLLESSGSTNSLSIGGDGITVASTAGAVTLGDPTNLMPISITGSQTWTNNSTTNALTVVSAICETATSTLSIAGAGNTNISGVISNGTGTLGLTMNGAGTLTLSGNNTYTGATTVNNGLLNLGGTQGTTGTIGTSARLIINSGGTAAAITNNNSLLGPSGTAAGVPTVTINAGGTLTTGAGLTDHLSALTLAGGTLASGTPSATFGSWNLDAGVTVSAGTNTLSTISATGVALTQAGGTVFNVGLSGASGGIDLNVTGTILHSSGASDTGLIKSGAGVMQLNGVNTYTGATTINAGTLQVGGSGSLGGGSYAGAISNASSLIYNSSAAQTLSGAITGTGSIAMSGASTLTLSSASTNYTGATTISAGTLALSNTTAFASPITVNSGATLLFNNTSSTGDGSAAATVNLQGALVYNAAGNNYWTWAGPVTANATSTIDVTSVLVSSAGLYLDGGLQGSANVTVTSHTNGLGLVLRDNNSTYSGTMTVIGTASAVNGTGSGLALDSETTALASANFTVNGTLELAGETGGMGWASPTATGSTTRINALNGTGVVVANFNSASSTATFSVGNANGGGTFSGVIANSVNGTMSFTKNGTGTQILSGANTYTGTTTVNGGTLQLNFAQAGAPPNNILASTSPLALGGGILSIVGNPSGTASQSLGAATLTGGTFSELSLNSNGGTGTSITVASWSRGAGATVDITPPSSGTITATGGGLISNNGVLTTPTGVAYASANGGTTWATAPTATTLGAYSGSFATGTSNYTSTNNVSVTNGDAPSSNFTVNTLSFNSATDGLSLTGAANVVTGGILVTPTATSASISSGTITSSTGGAELAILDYGALTIGSAIGNNGSTAVALTVGGTGTTTLTGTNTYTGATYLGGGVLRISAVGELGVATSPVLTIGGGTLQATTTMALTSAASGTPNFAVTLSGGGGTFDVTSANTLTVGGVIGGTGGLTKIDTGTLTLTGTDTYTGPTTVNAGTLKVGNGGTTGTIASTSIAVASGATLAYNLSTGYTATPVSAAGNVSYTSAGVLTLNAGTYGGNQLTFQGTNVQVGGNLVINGGAGGTTITGSSTSAAGVLWPGSHNLTATGNVTITGTSTAGSFIDGISAAGTFTDTTGTLTFIGTAGTGAAYGIEQGVSGSYAAAVNTFGNVTFKGKGGTTRNSDLNLGAITGNGTVTLVGQLLGLNSNTTFASTGGLPYNVVIDTTAGSITGLLGSGTDTTGNGNYTINSAGSVTFTGRTINAGTGTISLTSASGYNITGNSTLQGGTLTITDSHGIAINSGVALTLNATGSISNVISDATTGGALTIAGGAITLTGANTYTGATTLTGGTLTTGSASALQDSIVTLNGGALNFGSLTNVTVGGLAGTQNLALTNAAPSAVALTVGNNNTTSSYAQVLSGAGSIIKTGTGTFTLTGANAYTGLTTVSAGTLAVSGAGTLSGTTGLSVAAGATFSYLPTTAGALTLGSSSTLTLANGSMLGLAYGDSIAVSGAASVPGNVILNMSGSFTSGNPYPVLSAASGLNTGNYYAISPTTSFSVTQTPTTVTITPGTALTALTTAFWTGGMTGDTNVWALSNGTASNWAATSGGAAQPLVPTSGTSVTISSSSVITTPTSTVLGANMTINNLTIADTLNGLGLAADGNTLTITPTLATTGITMSAFVPTSTIATPVSLGANQTWTNNSANNLTVSGVVSGAHSLTIAGTGTGAVILTAADTYSGGTTINGGTLQIGNGGTTGSIPMSPLTVASGGTLAFNYSNAFTPANLSVAGNLSYKSAGTLTISGTYGGNQLAFQGAGSTLGVTLGGALIINAGAGGATITGSTTGSAQGDGGVVWPSSQPSLTTTGNVTITGSSTGGQFRDGISVGGALTATTGTLTLIGTAASGSSYGIEAGLSGVYGGTISTFGNVVFKGTGADGGGHNGDLALGNLSGNGTVTLVGQFEGLPNNGTFTASGGLPYNVVIDTTNGASINGQLGSGTDTTGNGNYTINSAGSVTFNGRTVNAGTGAISLTSTSGYFITGSSTLQSATLTITDSNSIAISSGATLALNANATISNVIGTAATAGALTIGGHTVTLTGAEVYTGATTINSGGVLQLGNGGTTGKLSNNSAITDNGNITFDRSDNPTQGTDFTGGSISGTGSLTQAGGSGSILTLNVANGYTGSTNVNSGTLAYGINNALAATGAVNVGGGTLSLGAFSGTVGSVTLTGGSITSSTGILTGTAYHTQGGSISAILAGSAVGLTQTTGGTTILTAADTYTGPTLISGGVLQIGNGGASGSLSTSSVITDNANLTFGRSDNPTQGTDFSGSAITGSGSLTQTGSGILTLTAANSYLGGTTIGSGTLRIGNGLTTGSVSATGAILDNASLTFNRSNTVTQGTDFSSSGISGSGSLTQAGSGNLVFNVANSYTGATNVNAGMLTLNASGSNTGALGNTAVTVAGGAALQAQGNASIGTPAVGASLTSSGIINLQDNSINTLTVGNGLVLNSATLDFDIGSTSGSNDSISVTSGTVSTSGTTTVNLNIPSIATGTYTLISAPGGGLSAGGAGFVVGTHPAGRSSYSFSSSTTTAEILSIVTNPTPTTAYWTGLASNTGSDTANNWGFGSASSNWSTNQLGTMDPNQVPGGTTTVYFTAANASSVSGALTTQLDSNYNILGLNFDTSPATTPISSVSISTNGNQLTLGTGGLTVASTNTANVTISGSGTGVLLGGSQNWQNNSSSTSLTVSTAINGTAASSTTQTLTFNGTGTGGVILNGAIGDGGNLGNVALVFSQAGVIQLNGSNSFSGGLTINSGTVQLNAINSFTGGVTINGGTIRLGNAGALNASTPPAVVFGAGSTGTLSLNNNSITVSDLSTNATVGSPIIQNGSATAGIATLTVNTVNADTFAGVLQDGGAGQLGLTLSGTGSMMLSGANSFSGPLNVQAGTLRIGTINDVSTNGPLGNSASAVGLGSTGGVSGTLEYTGGLAGSGKPFTIASGGAAVFQVDTGATNLTLSGLISGGGPLTKTGAGTLTLSDADTYSGLTTISNGTLAYGVGNALPTSGAVNVNGGTLSIGSFSGIVGAVTLTSGSITGTTGVLSGTAYNTQGGTISASLIGGVALTQTTGGTTTLSGANSYTGATNVQNGTLVLGTLSGSTVGSLANSTAVTLGSGTTSGIIQLGDAGNPVNQTISNLSVSGSGGSNAVVGGNSAVSTLTVAPSGTDIYAGVLGGSGSNQNNLALAVNGAGTLILTGANTYAGATTVTAGTLQIGNGGTAGSIASTSIAVASGATLAFNFSNAYTAPSLTVAGNLSAISGGQLTLSGTYGGHQLTAQGASGGIGVFISGPLVINAGAGGATIMGSTTGGGQGAGGIVWSSSQPSLTATGNVTLTGSDSGGQFIDGISVGGALTDTTGTLTLIGTSAAGGAYGIQNGVSGIWGGTISTFGNVVFKGTGANGSGHVGDLNLANLSGNGTVTLIGQFEGLPNNGTFTASGGLPYNVVIDTTNGASINGQLGSGTDTTGNGNYTINSAGSVTFGGRTVNAGTGTISLTSTTGYSVTANSALNAATLLINDSQGIAISSGVTLSLNATGSIANVISGTTGNLTVAGGLITLTSANSYTGTTTVSGGTLRVANAAASSATGTSAVSVSSGGTLAGSLSPNQGFITGGVTINSGGTISASNSNTLTLSGGLTLASGSTTSTFNLTGAPSANPLIATSIGAGSSLVVNGTDAIAVTGTPSAGTYDLFSFMGTAPSPSSFALPSAPVGSQYFLNITSSQVNLSLASTLTWTANNSTSWDTSTPNNWAAGSAAETYVNGIGVAFNDSNATGGATPSGAVVVQVGGVAPTSVTFNNSSVPYVLSNASADTNGISGMTGVTLQGTGTVRFNSPNTYTGTTALNAGTLIISDNDALGSTSGTIAPLTFNGGTLRYAASATNTDISSRQITISSGGATLDINGNNVTLANAIGGSGTGALTVIDSGSAATLTLTGTNTFTGPINLNGGAVSFIALPNLGAGSAINFAGGTLQWASNTTTDISTRTVAIGSGGATFDINGNNVTLANAIGNGGSGGLTLINSAAPGTPATLTLAVANSYSGATNVNSGTLRVSNTSGSATGGGSVAVSSGATLAGGGVSAPGLISGNVTLASLGTIAPSGGGVTGAPIGVGTLTVGGLALNSTGGSLLNYQVSSNATLDSITITNLSSTGTLTLPTSGSTTFNFYIPGTTSAYTFVSGETYPLMTYQSVIGGGSDLNFILSTGNGIVPLGDTATFATTTTSGPGTLELVISSGVGSAIWSSTSNSNYDIPTNWTPGIVPNAPGLVATFGTGTTQDITFSGGNYTVGRLVFNNPNPSVFYSVGSDHSGSLTLNNSGGGASVVASNGAAAVIGTTLTLADPSLSTTFNIDSSSSLEVTGPINESTPTGQKIILNGGGILQLDNGANAYTGGTTVNSGTLIVDPMSGTATLGSGPLAINGSSSVVNMNSTLTVGSLSGSGGGQLNVAGSTTLTVNQSTSSTFNGTLTLDGGLVLANASGNTLTISGAPTLGSSSSITVNFGTLALTNNTGNSASVTGTPTASVAIGATLQLAGSSNVLSSAVNVTTHGSGLVTDGALTVVGASTQTVGIVSGDTVTTSPVTTYSGNTTVGDGTNAANLTATQILQNTLTINAGSTVTIAPSGSGIPADAVATSDAVSSAVTADSSDSSADPFTAIQAAIASGSISSAKGQQLENRIAAIERLAATDPGLDVSLLEDRVLAAIPAASVWSSSGTSPLIDSGSGLLATDASTIGLSSGSTLGDAAAAFAPSAAFGGSPVLAEGAAVPEPSTLLLAALAGIGALIACRQRIVRRTVPIHQ